MISLSLSDLCAHGKGVAVTALLLMLLLAALPFSALIGEASSDITQAGIVTVNEPIMLNANGSIYPSTAPISTSDYVTYTLTADIYFDFPAYLTGCLRVERNDTIINGAGHTLQGRQEGFGIELSGKDFPNQSNVTVANLTVTGFEFGFWVVGSFNNIVENNIVSNKHGGVEFGPYGHSNTVVKNNILNNTIGISIGPSSMSSNNTIQSNRIAQNRGSGILLDRSRNTVLGNVISENSDDGIVIFSSFDALGSIVDGNVINANGRDGINIYGTFNEVRGNSIMANRRNGISIHGESPPRDHTANFTGYANTIARNDIRGFSVTKYGIQMEGLANKNSIVANNLEGTESAFNLRYGVTNNTFLENRVANSSYAVSMSGASGNDYETAIYPVSNNTFFHNNFVNNTQQTHLNPSDNSRNTWDDGYPSGGNYWSDYQNADVNRDGIGDAPYVIDVINQDNYPLMNPFNITVANQIQPILSISAQPNPTAVGGTVLLNMAIAPPTPTPTDRFNGLTISIASPDGPLQRLGPFMSDANGLLHTYFTPAQVGNYGIQLSYSGQFFDSGKVTYLAPQSLVTTLRAQQQPLSPKTWIVDDDSTADFRTIQEAINAASNGEMILVQAGTYQENPVVNKSLSLIGEGAEQTTITGKTTGKIITVTASKVTIAGFRIQGSGGTQPKPYDIGIFYANPVTSSNISYNTIAGHGYGVSLRGSAHVVESNYVIENTISGIYLNGSSNDVITRNNVTGDKTGIFISWPSSNNILRNNIMTGDELNLHVVSYDLPGFMNDIDTSNTVNGKPVFYWIGKTNQVVPRDAGTVFLINSVNITVQDLELSNSAMGVLLAYTTGSTVQRNNITNCSNGIRVQSASNNTLKGNNIYGSDFGIVLVTSSGNMVVNNTVSASSMEGIALILSSSGNQIYHNSFDNTRQAQADSAANSWDNGYPSGGNYWSNYNGTDANGDGIGDSPYIISTNNTDRYPLVKTSSAQSNVTTSNASNATAQPNPFSTASKEEITSASRTAYAESPPFQEATPVEEEPPRTSEADDQPFGQIDHNLSLEAVVIAVFLAFAVGTAFVGSLHLLRRKHSRGFDDGWSRK